MNILDLFKKDGVEIFILILFVISVLFVRIGQPWQHKISHTYPTYFNANDNFFHAELSDYIKEVGNYAFTPPYFAGGFEDMIGNEPPILHHLSAMLSYITNLETYDTTYIIVMFLSCFGYILMYFTIRKVNKILAILSLPFMLGFFAFSFEIAYAWGLYPFVIGSFFILAFFWCLENLDLKFNFILISFFLSGMALGHTSELIFMLVFLFIIFLMVLFINDEKKMHKIKNILIGFSIFIILSAYYLIIFYFSWIKTTNFNFSFTNQPGFASPELGVKLSDFGLNEFLFYLGLLFLIFTFLIKDESKKINVNPKSSIFIAGLYMIFVGFLTFEGISTRAFQTRIFWPIYLSPIIGLSIYFIPAKFNRWKLYYAYPLSIFLICLFALSHYNMLIGQGLIDDKIWEGIKWIRTNTPKDSKVYYFYSKFATQPYSLFSCKRVSYVVNVEDYIESLKKGIIKNYYNTDKAILVTTQIPYRTSLFTYNYHAYEESFKNTSPNMWDMDYYFFVIYDPYQPDNIIYIYNRYVKDFIKNQTWIEEVYSNEEVVILKNNEPGRKPL